jgi:hypothetical protein
MPDVTISQHPEPLLRTTFRVGRRYRCTLTIPHIERGEALAMQTEWSPGIPKRLSKREIQDYRRGRDAALAEVARLIGGNVLCVEV